VAHRDGKRARPIASFSVTKKRDVTTALALAIGVRRQYEQQDQSTG